MKSFTTLFLAASAAMTGAQVIQNPDGTFTCPIPNAAYCAGDSLTTNIIFRCIGTRAQPGNCNDNLAGNFPFGVNYAPCWQPDAKSGQAACSKNCIVYGGSGNYNGTFTIPGCVPLVPTTTAVPVGPSSTASTGNVTSSAQAGTTSSPGVSYTTVTNQYTTVTVPCDNGTPIYTPPGVTFPSPSAPAPTGGAPAPPPSGGNGTVTTPSVPPVNGPGGPGGPGGSPTATPIGPTATTARPPIFSGAANANQAGSAVAAAGLLVAYFL